MWFLRDSTFKKPWDGAGSMSGREDGMGMPDSLKRGLAGGGSSGHGG